MSSFWKNNFSIISALFYLLLLPSISYVVCYPKLTTNTTQEFPRVRVSQEKNQFQRFQPNENTRHRFKHESEMKDLIPQKSKRQYPQTSPTMDANLADCPTTNVRHPFIPPDVRLPAWDCNFQYHDCGICNQFNMENKFRHRLGDSNRRKDPYQRDIIGDREGKNKIL